MGSLEFTIQALKGQRSLLVINTFRKQNAFAFEKYKKTKTVGREKLLTNGFYFKYLLFKISYVMKQILLRYSLYSFGAFR